ncbi:MAG: xanthine dehydrogenase family protein molybdopterin-binding subunit [Novosphingobium sp.]
MSISTQGQAFRHIGSRPVRPDGVEKVTGKALYGPDFVTAGMLHGAILRSPHPHARIVSIDTRRAENLPGVKAVITGQDFSDLQSAEMVGGETTLDVRNVALNCMAHDKALYVGHAVAAVAATTPRIAHEALALLSVVYEILPHVTDIDAALEAGAPLLHEGLLTKGLAETPETPSNAALCFTMTRGDTVTGLDKAAAVASGRFTLKPVHQGYIEPHACVASWNADGQAQLWVSSQGAFDIRNQTAAVLKMRIADLKVTPLEIGGGFGGKTTIYLEPVTLLLSRKSGRPVRIAMSRDEVFMATGPAPGGDIDIHIGAGSDGTICGAVMEFRYSGGAFPGSDTHAAAMSAFGHYRIADLSLTGWDVVTNMPSTHAYRAPGAPQVTFAVESCLDDLASRLGMDPIDLRLKNAVRPGDLNPVGLPLGAIGFDECLEAAKAHPHYAAPLAAGQGRGIAAGMWGNYGGQSSCVVSIASDGTVLVATGSPDIGGSRASMAIMAAETFGVPYENVRVTIADTASIGYSMVTGGSRTTFATGMAVVDACKSLIETLRNRAAGLLGVEPADVTWKAGEARCSTGECLSIAAIATKSGQFSGPLSAEVTVNAAGYLPGYGVHICDSEVDRETGQVKITRYTAVQDVGRAIHPDYVEGQLQGGAAQGIGWALNEAYLFNAAGTMDNAGFLDYRMPVCSDLPMIDTVMVEVPNPAHPYGVKGVGETPIVPPLAAVANAVSRAVGYRLRDLPMTPDRVCAAIPDRD